jgi:hypothetical protein
MENIITIKEVDNLLKQKKKQYRKLKEIKINFLESTEKQKIDINSHFWQHLIIHHNNKKRPTKDIHSRLLILDDAFKVLQNSNYYQDKYLWQQSSKKAEYIFILGNIKDKKIGIVIRRNGQTKTYHLYSIIPNWKGYIPRIDYFNKNISIHRP